MPTHRHSPELKLLHGVEPRELVKTSPRPARREPVPPPTLSLPARAIWNTVVTELRDMDSLHAADTHEIAAYCTLVSYAEALALELFESKTTIRNEETGILHAHPLITAYDRLVGRAHLIATGLGLNPRGRSSIHGYSTAKPDTEAAQMADPYGA
jgi:P27 family predicted phage terminase small subunit